LERNPLADRLGIIDTKDLGCSNATLYRYAKAGLRIVRLGRRTVVLIRDWEKFLGSLPSVGSQRSERHAAAAAARWRKAREQAK
jgi:hypothetical protein